MTKKFFSISLLMLLTISLMQYGCAKHTETASTSQTPQAEKKSTENVYKGKIVGKSNKAKTISIEVGKGDKAKTIMVRFDDATTGVEFAKKGEAAIINYENRAKGPFATVIKPKLAKLPPGVTEIKTEELETLYEENKTFFLVDSRPASRYGQSHLPEAVSIPVPLLKEKKAALLPEDKDTMLIFYCGGPT